MARQELERASGNLRLAQGQVVVGSGTPMDVRQAEVAVGRARVNVLTSENNVRTGKFRLAQQMGLEPQDDFRLTSAFQIQEPSWTEEELTRHLSEVGLVIERRSVFSDRDTDLHLVLRTRWRSR